MVDFLIESINDYELCSYYRALSFQDWNIAGVMKLKKKVLIIF